MKARTLATIILAILCLPLFTAATGIIKETGRGLFIGTQPVQKIGFYGTTPVAQQTIIALTEGGSVIGGTNDGDLPSLTATYSARTNSTAGTADGTLALIGATNSGNVAGAINDNFTEVQTVLAQLAADNVALRAAARENAAQINLLRTKLLNLGVVASP